jgi:hypothetical protein
LHVLAPQDPQGGGTWIAANSAGLVFVLLNAHPTTVPPPSALRSRGLVIPSLADAATLEEVAFRIDDVPATQFAPCRLLAADGLDVAEFVMRNGHWGVAMERIDRPLLFTSSSLGDAIVAGPRRMLFQQMFAAPFADAAWQDAFHAHRWRDRPAVSVHMSRPEACTVSTTTVEVTPRDVRMLYAPAHGAAGTPVGLAIERRNVGDAAARRPRREHAAV